jgi:hypothetical protein
MPHNGGLRGMLFILLCFTTIIISAQPKINSPYSRYGFGEISDRNFFFSENMGGLGGSIIHPHIINIVNPASLGFLETTAFDMGVYAKSYGLRDLGDTEYTQLWSGNLSYLSLAVPLQNKLNDLLDRKKRDINATTAFTLKPFSVVGYNITTQDSTNTEIGSITRNFTGEGGTYNFTWSNAVKYKNLSLGLNLSYLFGKIDYTNQLFVNNNFASFVTSSENGVGISGFQYNVGLIYNHYFNLDEFNEQKSTTLKQLSIGLYGNSKTSYTSTESQLSIARQISLTGLALSTDTLGSIQNEKFDGVLPSELGFGISYYHGEKFALGLDYVRNDWSKFQGNFVNNPLKSTYKLSFGGFYRPNYKSISSYFSRVYYRFGVHYRLVPSEDLIINGGESIRDVGLNFGMGMPFFYQRKISHANIGVSAGYLGQGTAIEERYVKLTFSFTFNDDEWFVKRKYN